VNSIEEIAQVYRAQRALKMNQGLLIANPIPENYSLDYTWIDEITERATREAEEKRIEGKELTPFLLERLAQFTHGESLMANTVLLKHNAALAGELATYMFS
ncbi:MAG: pseudouridine-5'-phosphate glycosidase, partial [Vulcanimicrobiota bacterium]